MGANDILLIQIQRMRFDWRNLEHGQFYQSSILIETTRFWGESEDLHDEYVTGMLSFKTATYKNQNGRMYLFGILS